MIKDNEQYNQEVTPTSAFEKELREKLPEFFGGGTAGFDYEKFKAALRSNGVKELKDGYQLNFIGKDYARRQAGELPTSVIVPDEKQNKDEGKDSKNLFFTGDNLEVLRQLQANYAGKIDVIYIDPPYNTGNDGFTYPDKFEYPDDKLEELFGLDDSQIRKLKSIQGNSSHSAWLTFIYPRIFLAKKFLSEKGVIFISIDDNEFSDIKLIMDEVFGEASRLATLIWDRNHSAQSGIFKVYHEYILVYAKKTNTINTPKSTSHEKFEAGALKKVDSRHPLNEFTFPKGTRFDAPDGTELTGVWGGAEQVKVVSGRLISEQGRLKEDVTLAAGFTQINQMKDWFRGKEVIDTRGQKIGEFYLNSSGKVKVVKERNVETPATVQRFGTQSSASDLLAKLFGSPVPYFSSPKPVKMLKTMINWFACSNSIILDFFAGSSTTADAVMQLNAEDGGNRKFIMVQLPEKIYTTNKDGKEVPTKGGKAAYDAGFRSIDEISRERIRRAAAKIKEEKGLTLPENFDGSFKHYRVVKPNTQTLKEIDEFDPNSFDLFNNMLDNFSSEKLNIPGNTSGEDTVLTTWFAADGYSFDADIKELKINDYIAHIVENNRLYLIKDGWTAENTKTLINLLGTNQLAIQSIVLFGYSFNIAELRELENALKQLDANVNLIKRY